jgi:hypothetical protein
MRTDALLLSALTFAVAGCAGAPAAEYRPAATVREVMESIVDPAADSIWGAVEIVATLEGTVEKQPRTDDEWQALRRHAVTLMEAGNLLLIPGRKVARPGEKAGDQRVDLHPDEIEARIAQDPSVWTSHARALQVAATETLTAIDARSVKALIDSGEQLDQACETCHQTYWYRPSPQPVTDPPPRPER